MTQEEHHTPQAKQQKEPALARVLSRESQQRRKIPLWGWGVAVLVGVLIVGTLVVVVRSQSDEISGIVTYTNLSRDHVAGKVNYPEIPPVGGPHSAAWQTCGIYSMAVANENAVHSMEHGAVWITYQPQLSGQAIGQLRALVRGHDHALLSPYPGLPVPVVASGWGVQLRVTSASDARLVQFLKKYEQGPQTPEPGARCSSSTGTPDEQ